MDSRATLVASGPAGPEPAAVALDRLFRTEGDQVFGFVLARCGSRSMAEDVTGEVFAEAARVLAAGNSVTIHGGWLIDVARKRLVDQWRRDDRERRRYRKLLAEPVDGGRDADGPVDAWVAEALDDLPRSQRAALVLRYVDDFSVGEIAEAMATSYRAAESLLARARRSFVAAYEEAQYR